MKLLKGFNFLRLFLNLVFTGFILFAAVNNNEKNLHLSFIFLYNILLFVPAWINNFWFLPKLRKNKKIKRYLISVLALFIASIITLGQYLKWLYSQFNTTKLVDFTPFAITSPAPKSLEKYQHYVDVFPGILVLMIVMTIGYAVQEFLLKIKKEEKINTQQTLAELSLLKSQISPHFLFNVLNSLYALSLKKSEETPDVILKLSDILRYSLYESQEKEISIIKEIQILNTYIDIEKLRISENANITFNHDEVKDSVKIAPMLLLSLIENAFKHGTDSTIETSHIKAFLSCADKSLIFNCENSFKESSQKDFGGIGIENIRKRLQLLYPSKHIFEIEKYKDTFKVTLEIKF
ncbi:histidine kinase [Chryseobacterium sp. 09-1422]|uniref:Histidine kinase n=1 Tax=Chryseobacterium kimseyorum TaxID=2984028 RepID=A0ABT3I080_9FLAO|nr:histidine kinase [Chryseobacterium kimseyorum]MCW3169451.1 histidine kinase [Chryseobacterium kimseyorum]